MPDDIDIEELERNVENLLRVRPVALKKLRDMAEVLARCVVADAARIADLVKDIREGDEAAERRYRQLEDATNEAMRTMSEEHVADAATLREVRTALEALRHKTEVLREMYGGEWQDVEAMADAALAKLGAAK